MSNDIIAAIWKAKARRLLRGVPHHALAGAKAPHFAMAPGCGNKVDTIVGIKYFLIAVMERISVPIQGGPVLRSLHRLNTLKRLRFLVP